MEKLLSEVKNLEAADIEVQWWRKDLMAFVKALEEVSITALWSFFGGGVVFLSFEL